MNISRFVKLTIAISIPIILSCNLFAPKEPNPDRYYMTGEAWVIEGKKKMWDKDWVSAYGHFSRAIDLNNGLSEAYFYRGKCWLRIFNVDLTQVWEEVKPDNERDVPFLYRPTDTINYDHDITLPLVSGGGRFDLTLVSDLVPTAPKSYEYTKNTVPYTAYILIDSVYLQRKRIYDAVATSIKELETIHYNWDRMDGVITRQQYESDYLVELCIKTILGILDINNDGKLDYTLDCEERNAFRILCNDIVSLDSLEFDSLKSISKDPRDIRENLDSILQVLENADTSYNNFKKDLDSGAQQNSSLDTGMASDIGKMIKDFKKILPYFYYDDFKDNDGDSWNTNKDAQTTRMIWIDWDHDTLIDVYPPGHPNGHVHIGDTAHWEQNPTWYDSTGIADENYRRYRYKGPYTWEFIGGDWGVDEEILDGHDNDNDGLVDEDSRITADSLDDDGDWFDTDKLLLNGEDTTAINNADGNTYHPMLWDNQVVNDVYIDVVGTPVMVDIDPEYSLIHNTPKVDNSSTDVHYPLYLKGGDTLIGGQVVPKAWFYWPANSTIPRYNLSDWSGQPEFEDGDYGLDEEWYDGLDNDRDGLVDEDVGERNPPESMRDIIIDALDYYGITDKNNFITGL
jgi:hypothetical protein